MGVSDLIKMKICFRFDLKPVIIYQKFIFWYDPFNDLRQHRLIFKSSCSGMCLYLCTIRETAKNMVRGDTLNHAASAHAWVIFGCIYVHSPHFTWASQAPPLPLHMNISHTPFFQNIFFSKSVYAFCNIFKLVKNV